jgi:hypothetical protein
LVIATSSEHCQQKVFAERLPGVTDPQARETGSGPFYSFLCHADRNFATESLNIFQADVCAEISLAEEISRKPSENGAALA